MKYEKFTTEPDVFAADVELSETSSYNYARYSHLTQEYGLQSPQHQGLARDEFEAAIIDPNVASTTVETPQGNFSFPQLSPLEQNGWLNTKYYEKKYAGPYEKGDVMFYVDLPSITPGEAVKNRLSELADRGGVIVFDYPMTDEDYPKRVDAVLDELGITAESTEVLGDQTYYMGQTFLKRTDDKGRDALGFDAAYNAVIADGSYDTARIQNGASLWNQIDETKAQELRQFYDAAYETLKDQPCEQGLTPEEFKEMLTDRTDVAKIVNSVDGEIVSLVLLDNKLDKLSWVNSEYYKQNYPEKFENGQIMWFPGLAADPGRPESMNTQVMVDLIAQLGERGGNAITVVFDCCDKNKGFLDAFLNVMINATPYAGVDIQPIAVQRYMAVRLGKR
jgi:hypothetical protein